MRLPSFTVILATVGLGVAIGAAGCGDEGRSGGASTAAASTPAPESVPAVLSVTPASGPAGWSQPVLITGANLAAGAALTFGGVAATEVAIVSSTTLRCRAPASPAGVVDVRLVLGAHEATLVGGYAYEAPAPLLGQLDSSFADRGVGAHDSSRGGFDQAQDVAIDAQGRVVVVGESGKDLFVSRFGEDGALDPSFSGGLVTWSDPAAPDSTEYARSVIVDAQGRIVIAGDVLRRAVPGRATNNPLDALVCRFQPDGALDTTFGAGGHAVLDLGGSERGYALALDEQGRLLVAGTRVVFRTTGRVDQVVVWRVTSTGAADPTFGVGGAVTLSTGGASRGRAIEVDRAGRILVAGYLRSTVTSPSVLGLWRLLSDGSLDRSFGVGGVATHDGGGGASAGVPPSAEASALAIDAAGRIVVGGSARRANLTDAMIWRFRDGGVLDPSFARGGFVVLDDVGGGNLTGVRDVKIDRYRDGIVACGHGTNRAGDFDLALWVLEQDGGAALTFGVGGALAHDGAAGGGSNDMGSALAIDARGRLVVVGDSRNGAGDDDVVVWRYR